MRVKMVAWAVAVVVCAGCGESAEPPPPTPPPGPPGPCDLLTADEIRGVLGEVVLGGEASGYECSYTRPPNETSMRYQAVRLRLEYGDAEPLVLLSRYQEVIRQTIPEYDPAPISGVGDTGAWDGDAITAAVALGGGRSAFLSVQLSEVDPNLERAMAQALAERAIANLKQRTTSAGQ
jgi:hypothetical protein